MINQNNMNMRTLSTIIALAVLAFSTIACSQKSNYNTSGFFNGKTVKASKNYVTKDIKVDNFTKINLTGSPDVTYTQKAGKPRVEIYTSDNIINLMDVNVKNGVLNVGFKKGTSVSYNKLEIRISSETLNGVSIAGSGDIAFTNGLKTDFLKIAIAGSGDIKANNISCTNNLDISVAGSGDIFCSDVTCTNLKASVAGSGDMKLKNITATNTQASVAGSGTAELTGTTQEATYSVAGSGDLYASDFQAKRASASVTGSGDIKCHVTDFLKVRTSGSGSVGYKGNPELDYPKKGLYKL